MNEPSPIPRSNKVSLIIISSFLLLMSLWVLRPFLESIVWAGIMVAVSWPVYSFLLKRFTGNRNLASLIMCGLWLLLFVLLIVPISLELVEEVRVAPALLQETFLKQQEKIDSALDAFPIARDFVNQAGITQEDATLHLVLLGKNLLFEPLKAVLFNAASMLGIAFFALFVAFFIFRDARYLAGQVQLASQRLGGQVFSRILDTTYSTCRGVFYGLVMTAVAQGSVAALGFYLFDAKLPIFLGLLTMILSFIPFGPPLVYAPVAALMFIEGVELFKVIGLLIWGIALVSTLDNLIRPLIISKTTQLSVLLTVLGIVGGLLAFGLVGIFVGPLLLSVLRAQWLEFIGQLEPKDSA